MTELAQEPKSPTTWPDWTYLSCAGGPPISDPALANEVDNAQPR